VIREFVYPREYDPPEIPKTFAEDPTSVALRRFTDGLYRETAMNEFVLHRHVHAHFVENDGKLELTPFVRWLYREVFLMPLDSPTLGLERQVDLFDVAGEYDPSPVAPK